MNRYDDGANRSWEHPNDQWFVQITEEVHGSQEPHQSVKSTYLQYLSYKFCHVKKYV